MEEESFTVSWWSDPNSRWLPKILDHIKASSSSNNDITILHCEDVTGFSKSIPLTNYFFNLYLILNSLSDKRIMYLNIKDIISCIELHLARQDKINEDSDMDVADKEIMQFYVRYVNSYKENFEDYKDISVAVFKKFLEQNNCIDIKLLLDFYFKYDKNNINNFNGQPCLILGTPSSPFLKEFIGILSGPKICKISVETPLDASLHKSPDSQIFEKVKVVEEYVEVKDMIVNSEMQTNFGSASEEYVEDIIISFLSLLVSSRNELSLSKAMVSPVINLSHVAFTALKHLSIEKDMPMCQVAISYVTRIRLGGKGYAPADDCPMLPHLKGLELFVDTLNQMQTVIEEDSCPSSAIKRLINILKRKLFKCNTEKLKNSSIETVTENLKSTLLTVSEIVKPRVSSNASQICQGTLDILFHFINFINCSSSIYNPEVILSKKKAKRTPLNLPPLLGYFRSPNEESSCGTNSTFNGDSILSRTSMVQSVPFPSYFHHSESSEVTSSCVYSSTPSKLTFKDCLKESLEKSQNEQKVKTSEIYSENSLDVVPPKKNCKRSILSEITNENTSVNNRTEVLKKNIQKVRKTSENRVKENEVKAKNKKPCKMQSKRGKKFKQIEGQGKITSFFFNGKS